MTRNSQKIFGVIVGFIVLAVAVFVVIQAPSFVNQAFAQTNGDAGGFIECGNEATKPCTVDYLFKTFITIINYLIAMAGFIAVIAIVYAGFMMVYSQGQEQLKAAKGRLSGAVIGLVLVAGAFILINALFSGSLSIGVCGGGGILSNPVDYINSQGNWDSKTGQCVGKSNSTPSTPTTPNTNKPITNTAPKNTPIPKPGK